MRSSPSIRSALLTTPSYLGTLAAVRGLGAAGVRVTVAADGWLAPARWSKHAAEVVACPPPRPFGPFLDWLLAHGARHPGQFLYATSDDLLWLFAENEAALRERFALWQPPRETVLQLLDKKRLYELCAKAGLATVQSWYPRDLAEVRALAPSLPYPIFLKPRTQAGLSSLNKGGLATGPAELLARFGAALTADRYPREVLASFGDDVQLPFLQRYLEQAVDGIYSLAGCAGADGRLLGARASVKVLQKPRRIGIGLCFESAPVAPELAEAIARLCREAGYFGVFEAELILDGGQHHLIDFNPRFYGQMGFEHARGLPLAQMALAGAAGNETELARLSAEAVQEAHSSASYSHSFYFQMLLHLRRAAGAISAGEHARWREWLAARRASLVDASASPSDRLPGWIHDASEVWRAARHPRAFFRGLRE